MILDPEILRFVCESVYLFVCPCVCPHVCFLMDAKENARPLPDHLNFCGRVGH